MIQLPFLTGSCQLITNGEEAFGLSYMGVKVIALSEEPPIQMEPENNPNVINGNMLLPPVEAYWSHIGGDARATHDKYLNYLCTETSCSDMLSVIIMALHRGINLCIWYDDKETMDFVIPVLIEWLFSNGICFQGIDSFAGYNPSAEPVWDYLLYQSNLIPAREFLYWLPKEYANSIPQAVMMRLIAETNVGGTLDDQIEYIKQMCETPMNLEVILPLNPEM